MFSPEFKIAIMKEVFKDGDWGSMHDAILEATDKSYSEIEIKSMFMELPETIQADALKWGLGDTEVGDNIYTHFEKVKDNG
jgi:hypothetical protein